MLVYNAFKQTNINPVKIVYTHLVYMCRACCLWEELDQSGKMVYEKEWAKNIFLIWAENVFSASAKCFFWGCGVFFPFVASEEVFHLLWLSVPYWFVRFVASFATTNLQIKKELHLKLSSGWPMKYTSSYWQNIKLELDQFGLYIDSCKNLSQSPYDLFSVCQYRVNNWL